MNLRLQRQLLQFDQSLRLQQTLNDSALIAGIDEAGRGPLAGTVVSAAVILTNDSFTVSINDSKQMTPVAREKAYCALLRSNALIGVGAASPVEIDQIGIHKATHLSMRRALAKLKKVPDLVLVDGKIIPPGFNTRVRAIVDGDAQSFSIAAASIVAKVVRDQWMGLIHAICPEYQFKQHKGYGTANHLEALRELGPGPFHRYSFQPVRESAGISDPWVYADQ